MSAAIKSMWIGFIYGHKPWPDAFGGAAATLGLDETRTGPAESSRGWEAARLDRMRRVKKLGFLEFVQLATKAFP